MLKWQKMPLVSIALERAEAAAAATAASGRESNRVIDSLAALASAAGATVDELLEFTEAELTELAGEENVGVVQRTRIVKEAVTLKAASPRANGKAVSGHEQRRPSASALVSASASALAGPQAAPEKCARDNHGVASGTVRMVMQEHTRMDTVAGTDVRTAGQCV